MHDDTREVLRMRIDLRGEIPPPDLAGGQFGTRLPPLRRAASARAARSTATGGAAEASTPSRTGCRRSSATASSTRSSASSSRPGDELVAGAICWTSAFVKDIVVRETWRRHGLGEALLRLAFRTFQERGATRVELKVQAQNAPAIRLYERVGMRTIERLSGRLAASGPNARAHDREEGPSSVPEGGQGPARRSRGGRPRPRGRRSLRSSVTFGVSRRTRFSSRVDPPRPGRWLPAVGRLRACPAGCAR